MSAIASTSLPENAVEIIDLRKTYRAAGGQEHKVALRGVSLSIPRGSVFGLLGPNGAGKSTLINIMAGLTLKSGGTVRIWGRDIDHEPRNARAAIGVVPQEINIDPFFTPWALLDLQAGLYGVPRRERQTEAVLKSIGLWDKRKAYARALSGGMRRRVLIGKAMVHRPPVLVLDEPTAGVDIEMRRQLWDSVRALNREGVTVLLTTHYLEEAEQLCDRIAIINHGRVSAQGETKALLQQLDSKSIIILVKETLEAIPETLARFAPTLTHGRNGGPTTVRIAYHPSTTNAGDIVAALAGIGLSILDISTEETDLEDLFLQLMAKDDGA